DTLGILVEWQRVCAQCGVPSSAVGVTDEQLIALDWWVSRLSDDPMPAQWWQRETCMTNLIESWGELTTGFCAADDGQHLKATEKPDLEFVRQVVEILRQSRKHSPVDSSLASVQSIAQSS